MRRTAALAACALALAACGLWEAAPQAIPTNHFRADARDLDTVRRVMVLPFDTAPGVAAHTAQIREEFVAELTKLQRFEVVPLPPLAAEHQEIYEGVTRGRLSTDALVALSERYRVDGVLLGTVTNCRAYPPMSLGLRLQIVSLHSGSPVWAVDGLYDANDARVVDDLEHYAVTFAVAEASMHGWELNLISPRKYAAYVAHRLVSSCR